MKSKLLLGFTFLLCLSGFAQAPVINGETLLCPGGSGTATVTNGVTYDSYIWMSRDMGSTMPFIPIPGETGPTFTYTAFDYSLKEIRLAALLGDVALQSNILLIDSLLFIPIYTITQESPDISFSSADGSVLLCTGGTFDLSVAPNYNSNVKWFRDGVQVAQDQLTYIITTPGEYWVSAAPAECPDYVQTSLVTLVSDNPDCALSVPSNQANMFSVYPNPAKDKVHFNLGNSFGTVSVSGISGQKIMQQPARGEGSVDVSSLSSGIYILSIFTDVGSENLKLIKE